MLRILLYLVFITIFSQSLIYGAEYPECINEPLDSLIAIANNCSKAIYCNGVNSAIAECDRDKPYFSSLDKKCYNSTNVCDNRPFSIPIILSNSPENTTQHITSTVTTSSLATTTKLLLTSNANIFPITAKPTPAAITISAAPVPPATITISEPSVPPAAIITSEPPVSPVIIAVGEPSTLPAVSTTIISSSSTEIVPNMVNCRTVADLSKPLYLPKLTSCSEYYLCYQGIATLMNCPRNLHFDAIHQNCNTPEEARCQNKPTIPINQLSLRERCQSHTLDRYPHPKNCNYYYRCEYGFLIVMQCPFNMNWDRERKSCAWKSRTTCHALP